MTEPVAVELRKFAAEVHLMAYVVPAGQGEYALLQLAQRMHAEADRHLRHSPMSSTQLPNRQHPRC
jgi:hypothetical protein